MRGDDFDEWRNGMFMLTVGLVATAIILGLILAERDAEGEWD